jgi:hypothetical protein
LRSQPVGAENLLKTLAVEEKTGKWPWLANGDIFERLRHLTIIELKNCPWISLVKPNDANVTMQGS